MRPDLSVIVPVYNVENELMRCVNSLRKQTLFNMEIILVDDGSTDSSGNICDRLAEEDDRVQVFHKQNEGQGIARNCGIELAKGKYIAFVDSDDYIEEETYKCVILQMEAHSADIASFGYTQEDKAGNSVYQSKIRERVYCSGEVKNEFVLHFFGDDPEDDDMRGVSACMSVYRSDIIREQNIRFPSERKVLSEDTLFNLEYCRFVNVAIACEKIFYHYCINSDSFSKGYLKERLDKAADFTRILSDYARKYGIEELAVTRIRMVLWISLLDAIKQEVRKEGLSHYFKLREGIIEICNRSYVIKLVKELNVEGFNKKQKLFYFGVKYRQYFLLILLAYVRNKQGLQNKVVLIK
ncbi:MAG: glycosyltransferase [Suilimivivens sp.]